MNSAAAEANKNEKNRRTFRHLCRLTGIALCLIATVYLIVLFVRGGGTHHTFCFNVDMLEHRVPGRQPEERIRTPLTLGTFCLDRQQLIVYWNIKEGFSSYFKLSDFTLRGPIYDHKKETKAPVVLALGAHQLKKHRLAGSRVIEQRLVNLILAHPSRYYLSLEGTEHGPVQEIGRHALDQPIKNK